MSNDEQSEKKVERKVQGVTFFKDGEGWRVQVTFVKENGSSTISSMKTDLETIRDIINEVEKNI